MAAFAVWQKNHADPRANMDIAYIVPKSGAPLLSANLYYNAPVTPPGTFDIFFNLPSLSNSYESNMPFLRMLTDKIGTIDSMCVMLAHEAHEPESTALLN